MVPEFFPFECSSICSTSCGKIFILKGFVGFVLAAKILKATTTTCLGNCRISDFWGVER